MAAIGWRLCLWSDPHDASALVGRSIRYRVLMEPLGTNVFFLAERPQSLKGNFRRVSTDAGGAVYNLDPENPITRYEAESQLAEIDSDELRLAANTAPAGMDEYLKLPPLDVRIAKLAEEITAAAPSNYEKAIALEHYLATHFGYTLELPNRVPHDPLANFLFERKHGHCEYFASSMAVMLRSLRIPSRIVTGFRGGEFNDLTGQYVVRASDAHSWVEAYFPGSGWISFDPTPAVACRRAPDGRVCSSMWMRPHLFGANGLSITISATNALWERMRLPAAGSSLTKLAGGSSVSIAPCCGRHGARTTTSPIFRCAGWAAASHSRQS